MISKSIMEIVIVMMMVLVKALLLVRMVKDDRVLDDPTNVTVTDHDIKLFPLTC